jgi:hypothetical protein
MKFLGGKVSGSMQVSSEVVGWRCLAALNRAPTFRRGVTVKIAPHGHMSGAPLLKRDKRPACPARIHDKAPARRQARTTPAQGKKKALALRQGLM